MVCNVACGTRANGMQRRCYNLTIAPRRRNASIRGKKIGRRSPRRVIAHTVLCVRRRRQVVMAGSNGQVTLGESVIKHGAKKIRRLYQDKISLDSPVPPPTPSPSSAVSRRNSSNITAIWPRRRRTRKDWRTINSAPSRSLAAGFRQRNHLPFERQGDVIEPDTGIAAIVPAPFAQAAAAGARRSHPSSPPEKSPKKQ